MLQTTLLNNPATLEENAQRYQNVIDGVGQFAEHRREVRQNGRDLTREAMKPTPDHTAHYLPDHRSALKRQLEEFNRSTAVLGQKVNGAGSIWKDSKYGSLKTRIGELAKSARVVIERGEDACFGIGSFFQLLRKRYSEVNRKCLKPAYRWTLSCK